MKRILICILIILSFLGSTSCSESQSSETGKNTADQTPKKIALKLYTIKMDMLNNPVVEYNYSQNHSYIDYSEFSNIEDLRTKMTTELLAGEGPDILRVDAKTFSAMHKIVCSGAFCDMNTLLSRYKDFHLEDYHQEVLNMGVFEGKRYLIPFGYDIPMLITFPSVLKTAGINSGEGLWTWQRLAEEAREIQREKKGRQYLFDKLSFQNIMQSSGISFIDYPLKSTHFASPEFINLLKAYKELYPSILPKSKYKRGGSMAGGSELESINMSLNKNCILYNGENYGLGAPVDLRAIYTGTREKNGERLVMLPFPTYSGSGGSYIDVPLLLGINNQSEKKEAAFDFIQFVLSKEYETGRHFSMESFLTPLNAAAYSETQKNQADGTLYHDPLPAELAKMMNQAISQIHQPVLEDGVVFKMIEDELPDFVDGKKTAEQTAKAIDDIVSLYLNE